MGRRRGRGAPRQTSGWLALRSTALGPLPPPLEAVVQLYPSIVVMIVPVMAGAMWVSCPMPVPPEQPMVLQACNTPSPQWCQRISYGPIPRSREALREGTSYKARFRGPEKDRRAGKRGIPVRERHT